jgi:hypothetical protein
VKRGRKHVDCWVSHNLDDIKKGDIIVHEWPRWILGAVPKQPLRKQKRYTVTYKCDICPPDKEVVHFEKTVEVKTGETDY